MNSQNCSSEHLNQRFWLIDGLIKIFTKGGGYLLYVFLSPWFQIIYNFFGNTNLRSRSYIFHYWMYVHRIAFIFFIHFHSGTWLCRNPQVGLWVHNRFNLHNSAWLTLKHYTWTVVCYKRIITKRIIWLLIVNVYHQCPSILDCIMYNVIYLQIRVI